ncbi:MAG: sulfite exporter TauE/SafE family protein [Ilumatobacteraceae bacterium]|nr:sulfite exporter TauE/SafE family protein [Ilumatobacteraceae bacterium]
MDAGILRDALTVVAGVGTGIMSGTFGVGGAVISTPAIRALGCSAAMAIGTTLPSLLPGAVSGSLKYAPQKLVRWNVVKTTVPAGVIVSIIGARTADLLPGDGHPLMILTALILMWSATGLIRGGETQDLANIEQAKENSSTTMHAIGVGIIAGGLSGLLGVGGGIVMVPLFKKWLALPMKNAIATSLICVGFFAVPGTITHTLQGGVDWRYALLLTIGVIPGAPLGAKLALSLSDQKLRRVFGIFLACIALIYGGSEIVSLLRN